jgi:hypothetical protein
MDINLLSPELYISQYTYLKISQMTLYISIYLLEDITNELSITNYSSVVLNNSKWRIHCGVEVTELSTSINKQHTLSMDNSFVI